MIGVDIQATWQLLLCRPLEHPGFGAQARAHARTVPGFQLLHDKLIQFVFTRTPVRKYRVDHGWTPPSPIRN